MFRVAVIGAVVLLPQAAAAQTPLRALFHQVWSLREGAPGTISGISQMADGQLLMASSAGVTRFDGVRFERVRLPGPPIRRPVRVWTYADGSLWVSHDRGSLTVVHHGERTTFTAADGLPALRGLELARDGTGTMWALGEHGLARLDGGRWHTVVPAPSLAPVGRLVLGLLVDRKGAIWVSVGGQVLVQRPGQTAFEPFQRLEAMQFAESPDGTIWALPRAPEPARAIATVGGDAVTFVSAAVAGRRMVFDHEGRLWLATDNGVVRVTPAIAGSEPERMREADGLSHDSMLTAFVDSEGNAWFGTAAGLDLFRDTVVTNADPLPAMHATRLAVHGADVWAGDRRALFRVRGRERVTIPVPAPVTAVHATPDGVVWTWAGGALWRGRADASFTSAAAPPEQHKDEAWGLALDTTVRLWGQFLRTGAWVLDGTRWRRPALDGLAPANVASVIADGSRGLWLSDVAGDAYVWTDGLTSRVLRPAEGQSIGQLSGVAPAGAATWLTGRAGLALADANGMHVVAGLGEDDVGAIRGIARQPDGTLWLNSDAGLIRLSSEEAARAVAARAVVPRFRVFDHLDGMIGGAAPRPPQSALVTPTGALWFVGYDRVYAIDPRRLRAASHAPPVRVTVISTDVGDFTAVEGLALPVGTSNLRVAYTGLSLTMPDRMRFRYHLDGVDHGWQDAGDRREAVYTNLAPGTYTFRVIASNLNGVWPETGAATTFVLPPALHQTTMFRVAMLAGLAGLIWAMVWLRVRHVTATLRAQHAATVGERERIARELHDTLLQGVHGLTLRFQAAASRLPAGDPAAAELEAALSRADDVLLEGRQRVRDLRRPAEASPDLAVAIARAGEELVANPSVRFALAIEGDARPLQPIVRDELFWIAREAITNAVRHAQGSRIEAELAYSGDQLRLRCRDDGHGMPARFVAEGRAEHFGLRGMRERAHRIGAELVLWSREGAGTELEVRVPGGVAYADRPAPPLEWFRRAWAMVGGR